MKKYLLLLLLIATPIWGQQQFTVFFDFNQYGFNPTALQKLEKWVAESEGVEVSKIYGFCDWKGTNVYNDSLSVKRVKTVLAFLKSKDIKVKDGYEIRGFGEDFEQSKVQSENRKVIIAYEIKKPEPKKEVRDADGNLPLQEQFKVAKVQDKIRIKNLYFFNMTPRILPKSKPVLYELLCALQDNPKLKIEIQGHICCQTAYDINNLSESRAKAVYNFLVSNKINRKRLSFKGYGTSNPIYPIPEKNEFEENENRRVEILILEN
jgi:outer membrane protein OmpA-like peptidoglycan-associated protein